MCVMTLTSSFFSGISDLPLVPSYSITLPPLSLDVLLLGPIHQLFSLFVIESIYKFTVLQKYGTNITFPQCHGHEVKWVLQKRLRRDSSTCQIALNLL